MADKQSTTPGTKGTISNSQVRAESSKKDSQQEQTEKEKESKKPEILTSKWVILTKDKNNNDTYKEISEAKIETKVKIELSIKNSDVVAGNVIDIIIIDGEKEKEVTKTKLTVDSNAKTSYSEEIEIKPEWLFKDLYVKVEQKEPFKKEFIGDARLQVMMFEFAKIYIKVIDARSRQPLKYAMVKKIVFTAGNKKITEEFDRNAENYILSVQIPKKPKEREETKEEQKKRKAAEKIDSDAKYKFNNGGRRYNYRNRNELIQSSMAVLGSFCKEGVRNKEIKMDQLPAVSYKKKKEKDKEYKYDSEFKKLFKEYWKERAPEGSNIEIKENEDEKKYLPLLRKMVLHYNSHVTTDEEGWLTLFIPKPFLDNEKADIEIGFFDFPVVLERITGNTTAVIRHNHMKDNKMHITYQDTPFKIVWPKGAKQETDWGKPFGWEIQHGDEKSELKVSEKFVIKEDTGKFEKFDTKLFSPFCEVHGFHFTLFAMKWCQPVWDEIEDNGTQTHIQDDRYKNLNMHIPTTYFDLGGNNKVTGDDYGGKGYGKTENRKYIYVDVPNPDYSTNSKAPKTIKEKRNAPGNAHLWRTTGHAGIDIHATKGANVYAIHGGTVGNTNWNKGDQNKAGRFSVLTFKTFVASKSLYERHTISYLHLNDFVAKNGQYVMAGQIIAHAGRTGNLDDPSKWPGHVHLNIQAGNEQAPFRVGLRENLNGLPEENLNLIPLNDFPLMFPCYCAINSQDSNNPTADGPKGRCNFNNSTYVTACWAVHELICPHMNDEGRRKRRIQAQLKFLGYNIGKLIDGDWGNNTSDTRKAILKFKQDSEIIKYDSSDYDMNEATDDLVLNDRVEKERPDILEKQKKEVEDNMKRLNDNSKKAAAATPTPSATPPPAQHR
ncbi:MAG: peptidoglycan DD-metalloendopeptidase family protein [Bacteroidetes bacterium]|nr:peptidoglycan DD-metalloendopeptidase family protein [Bacteroidota bacterium]MCL1968241.1 peptidoglycan DD-metalloendopeptidase family protein [Bacteroidota bacterium]